MSNNDVNQRCMICRAIGFVIAAIIVGLITWWLFGKVAAWLAIVAFLGLFALGLWLVLKYCGEPVGYGAAATAGAAVTAGAAATAGSGSAGVSASAHKFEGGCAHISTHSDHDPIDSHTCHCSVCKSVTGQDSTHVTFFNHADLKVSNETNLNRQPFNANNPDGPLVLCTCGDCGTPIMLDDTHKRIRAIVPNLMGHDPEAMPTTYHAFYDPATGVPRPNDGKPVYEGLRPDYVWPEGDGSAAKAAELAALKENAAEIEDVASKVDTDAADAAQAKADADAAKANAEAKAKADAAASSAEAKAAEQAKADAASKAKADVEAARVKAELDAAKAKAEAERAAATAAAAATVASSAGSGTSTRAKSVADGMTSGSSSATTGTKPQGLSAARSGGADDLKRIKGVGPKMENMLNGMGYYHFDQIGNWGDQEVAWVDDNLEGFKGRVTRDRWVPQARLLAGGTEVSDDVLERIKSGENVDLTDYDKDGVSEGTAEGSRPEALSGPRGGKADNLKEIKGVGPKMEKMLQGMGFYHFDQIAAWTSNEVAWVDANLEGFKGRVTRDEWVKQAKILATGGETEFSKRVDDGDVY